MTHQDQIHSPIPSARIRISSVSTSIVWVFLVLMSAVSCQTRPVRHETQKETQYETRSQENELIQAHYKSGQVTEICDRAIRTSQEQLDALVKRFQDRGLTPVTSLELLEFEKIQTDFDDTVLPVIFMSYVSTDTAVSQEASACEQKVGQFGVAVYTRKDLYEMLRIQKTSHPEEVRLLTETLKAFEKNGLKLPEHQLQEVRDLKQKLAVLESQFSTHLNQDHSSVELTEEELRGVARDFIESLPKSKDGKYTVAMQEPLVVRIMDTAKSSETRRKIQYAFENRAAQENTKLLEEALLLRQKIAVLMGYSTWADYRTQDRMAKNSKTILEFLNSLKKKLVQRNQSDLKKLLNFKQELEPQATELHSWDIRYLSNQLKKRDFSLDEEKIREYFPATGVITGLFQVYSKLFGVHFVEQKEAVVWAEGVKLYQIQEHQSKDILGYFYTDFLPRPGKFSHAAAFPLILGRRLQSNVSGRVYSHPVSAIVANFSAAEGHKPILLSHSEVVTLFHEFGHIMHQTLTRAPYASLAGSSVDHDFVEAPSQMLENWVYSKEILSLLSGHYLNSAQKLPDALLTQIIAARDFNQGNFYTRQLLFGLLDMHYHTQPGQIDVTQIYVKLYRELMGFSPVEGTHFPASFGHLMGGYDAGYYGYLWSEVYACDLFTRFEKEGLLNPHVGAQYRKIILEKGKMEEAFDLLTQFLKRPPNVEAFYKKLHIE